MLSLLSLLSLAAHSDIRVTDDTGEEIILARAAERIVSLAPNLTELLFAAGAGAKIVGTVRYSDWPAGAASIPQIGDSFNLDFEAIILLQPDLIVLWESGTGVSAWQRLRELGFNVYRSEPDTLDKIASSLVRLGRLAGTEKVAENSSRNLIEQIHRLRGQYAHRNTVQVFYQFWDRPMFTVNGHHLISHIIELCGGRNIYADLDALTPQINPESVLLKNPQVIIASGNDDAPPEWLNDWRQWKGLTANTNGHLYSIPPDYIQRHTPRIIRGATMMCEYIDRARSDQTG